MSRYGETIDIESPTFRRLKDDARIITQAFVMRLSSRRGVYFDDPEYGDDIEDLAMEGLTDAQLARLGARFAAEIQKDERVESATVGLTKTTEGAMATVAFVADVKPLDGDEFSLKIGVADLSVELLLRGA